METLRKQWKRLEVKNPSVLREASDTLHHAAQYIAMAGKYLIPSKPDDSHTNATWYPEKNLLAGREIETPEGKVRVALDYPLLILMIVDKNLKPRAEIALDGKTRTEVFDWMKEKLGNTGKDVSNLEPALHYDIPDHPVMQGEPFEMKEPLHYLELAFYRTNGHLLLKHFTRQIMPEATVLVWPHHFDEGTYVPLLLDAGGDAAGSISAGLAVADRYYPEPYFYVTAWKSEGVDSGKLPSPDPPGILHRHEWEGQVLPASAIAVFDRAKDQLKVSYSFLEQAIRNAITLISA